MSNVKIIYDNAATRITLDNSSASISQRDKLELILINLCSFLGITTVHKILDSRMNLLYKPDGYHAYQSATGVILKLSSRLAQQEQAEEKETS